MSLLLSRLSSAVSWSSYSPGSEKVTVVANEVLLMKVTVPGPLTLLHP